jgi:hypothetical protein
MLPDTWMSTPFAWLVLATVVFGLLGFLAFIALVRALRERRPLRAVVRLLLAIALDLAAVAALLLAVALHGYGRLTTETQVARLSFSQTGPQRFEATVVLPDERRIEVALAGDDWQLDARVVKWTPFAVLAGLDPLYKLDRISGRYQDVEAERAHAKTVHDLAADGGLDLWRLAQSHPQWLPFVDTEYGSGAYLPMRDGAVYDVTLSPLGGLVARPAAPSQPDADGRAD